MEGNKKVHYTEEEKEFIRSFVVDSFKEYEAACIDDNAFSIDAKFGRHDYKCLNCNFSVDYFIGGEGNWWCMTKPNYCPQCGRKLMKPVENIFRKEVKTKNDNH